MRSLITFLLVFFCISYSSAQFAQYTNGVPVRGNNYYADIQGSAYLVDDWTNGTVKIESGKVYTGLYLKYNELEDQVIYKGVSNEAMVFNDPIKEFTLTSSNDPANANMLFRNGYPPVQNSTDKSYFQVLADGKTQLLKRIVKQVTETKEFNSATLNKSFVQSSKFYLYLDGKLIAVKKDKKTLIAVLSSKQAELNNYINTNSLNLKEENDIVKLINYLNSI